MNDIAYHEWKTDKLDALFDLEPGYAFKSADFIESGVPVIKIKNVKAGYFSEHEFSYVDPKFVSERPTKVARYGDLLISMSGNRHDGSPETWVGKVSPYRKKTVHLINQRVGALRVKDPAIIDSRFAGYVLASLSYQTLFISIATSSGGQANISPMQILGADFYYPNIDQQRAIAHILGSLDDMIELNRRMNETLEGIARAFFQSWFVDFDPVRAKLDGRTPYGMGQATADLFPDSFEDSSLGPIPKGWRVGRIKELSNLDRNAISPGDFPTQTFNHFSLPAFDKGRTPKTELGSEIRSNKFVVTPHSVLLSKLNPHIPRIWLPDLHSSITSVCSTEFIVVCANPGITREYLYSLFTNPAFATIYGSLVTGTTGSHQRIKPDSLLHMSSLIPPVSLIKSFTDIVKPFFDCINRNTNTSHTLAKLRDTLLPKLLSGELSVDEAGRCVEEAV